MFRTDHVQSAGMKGNSRARPGRSHLLKVLALSAILVVSGCGGIPKADHEAKAVEAQSEQHAQELAKQVVPYSGAVEHFSFPKLAGKEVESDIDETLPLWMQDQIDYSSYSLTFPEVLRDVSGRINTSIRMVPTLVTALDSGKLKPISVEYTGTIKGLLDELTERENIFWRYKNGTIEVFDTETRTYHVDIPRTTRTVSNSITLGAPNGSGGGATSAVSSSLAVDTFSATMSAIKAIVEGGEGRHQTGSTTGGSTSASTSNASSSSASGTGGPTSATPTAAAIAGAGSAANSDSVTGTAELGIITVTTRPPVHDRVAAFVKALNDGYSQNLLIQVKILSVTANDDLNAGAMMNLIGTRGSTQYGTQNPTILQPTTGSTASILTFTRTAGVLSGSQIVANMLHEYGTVSTVRGGEVIAINGQPSAVQDVDIVTYLAQTTPAASTLTATSSSAGLTPSSVTVGLTSVFIPTFLADNRILLDYSLNLSSLTLPQITSAGQTIQIPQVAQKSLQQAAYVSDGQTLVLFSFGTKTDTSATDLGLLSASGNRASDKSTLVIVMDITRLKSKNN